MDDIWDAIENGSLDDVQQYVQMSPEVVTARPFGETPLHVAVSQRNRDIAAYLLQHGADVNAHGNNGRMPLHHAAQKGQIGMVDLLLEHGAHLDQVDDFGFSPLFTAARNSERELAYQLVQKGAKFDFHSAVCLGDIERVNELLAHDPQLVEKAPFKNDLLPDAVYAESSEIVRLLLANKAIDVDAYGLSGEPALIAAVSRNDYNTEIVQLLIDHGADPKAKSSSGDTATSRAKSVGEEALAQWLSDIDA